MANKKYTMAVQMSGTRNGQDWPGVGCVVTLPADEGDGYVAAGLMLEGDVEFRNGRPVPKKAENAKAPKAENAKRQTGNRSVKASTAPKVDEPAAADAVEAEADKDESE